MVRTVAFLSIFAASLVGLLLSDEQYVKDRDIQAVSFQDLMYPPLARQTRTEGIVVVQAKLNGGGRVISASAISGSELLVPVCLENVKKWEFRPNRQSTAVLVYNFRIPQARCGAATSFFTLEAPNFVTITGCGATVQP